MKLWTGGSLWSLWQTSCPDWPSEEGSVSPSTVSDISLSPQQSPYPVILSLENHCGLEQQATMARHMKTILGDMLLTETLDGQVPRVLPSPEVRPLSSLAALGPGTVFPQALWRPAQGLGGPVMNTPGCSHLLPCLLGLSDHRGEPVPPVEGEEAGQVTQPAPAEL